MIAPCQSCPWRKSTRTQDIPGGGMDHARAMFAFGPAPQVIMACHLTTDEKPVACAGWIERVAKPAVELEGEGAISARFLLARGGVALREFSDGGADLHESMGAMLDAHT